MRMDARLECSNNPVSVVGIEQMSTTVVVVVVVVVSMF